MLDFFSTLPLFSDVPTSALESLCKLSHTAHHRKNKMLIGQQANERTIFFIQSGYVKLVRVDEDGRECIHRIVRDEFFLPGTSLFYHDPLPVSAYCLTDATIIEVPQAEFERWLEPFPKTITRIAGEMNRRLYQMYEWAHQLAVSGTLERVHFFLDQLATTYGYTEADGVHIDLPVTQTEIAQMLGVSRESVNRVWNTLRRSHLLHVQNQSWVLSPDWQKCIC
ncbi:Crp/Fnr family transcriptional regulator [Alicyclobacillus curvatus]|nr:Crp/Fnr family transcriptional regulator [Alicyclobacillus curvatus]